MRRVWVIVALVAALGGCDQNSSSENAGASGNARAASYGAYGGKAGDEPAQPAAANSKLSYHHDLQLEMRPASVEPRYNRARELCLNKPQLNCTLMSASINLGDASNSLLPFASLDVRLPHDSVAAFEDDLLSPLPNETKGDAVLRSQMTSADDLTRAIADVERREAQLNDYRDRLTALSKRTDAKVEDLVKIESELSNVQNQLETIAAEKKGLDERVATERLNITLRAQPDMGNSLAPIVHAWRQGGRVLGESSGKAISFSISALPWLPIVGVGLLFIRFIFRRWRR